MIGGFRAPIARAASSPTTPIWSTQLDFDNNGTAWSESFFAGLAADGLTTAELNMPWGTIEPAAGTFSFTEWDQELANASAAGIQLIPIFWQAGWGGSPAPWINDFEVGSGGAQGAAPTWWDPTEQSEYFTYVTDTIQNAVSQPGGYGGAILDYGFLDAQWDLGGAGGGYAADDVAEFQNAFLPQTYGTIATFNSDNGTSYSSFSQVPAAAPGQALFGVFQAFRAWSVQQTYGQLTADVRNVTASTPLYYYFGGGFGNATNYANNPDTFFQLAKQYNVTVIDDDASSQGLTLTFGSLARAYGVKVAQEWTAPPDNSQLAAKAVSWLSLYAMGLPEGGGEDFFIHDGTEKDTVGFPIYTSWLPTLKGLSGTYPQQPAAVYVDFSQGYGNTGGGSLNNAENEIANLWLNYQSGFTVVTSQEVNNGAIKLSQFKAVLPLNGVDANLTAYKNGGGTLLTEPEQLTQYTTAVRGDRRAGRRRPADRPGRGRQRHQRLHHAREHHLGHRLQRPDRVQPGRARPQRRAPTTWSTPPPAPPSRRRSSRTACSARPRTSARPRSRSGTWWRAAALRHGLVQLPGHRDRRHLGDRHRRPGQQRPAVPRRRPDQRGLRRQPHPDHPGRRDGRGDLDVVAERRGRRQRLPAAQPAVRGRGRGQRDRPGHVLGHRRTGLHRAVRHAEQRLPERPDRQQPGHRDVDHGDRAADRRAVRGGAERRGRPAAERHQRQRAADRGRASRCRSPTAPARR